MDNKKTLCVVAGSSGGHILPALSICRKWLQKKPDGRILFISGTKKIDKSVLKGQQLFSYHCSLSLQTFSFEKFWLYPYFCMQFVISFFKSFFHLIRLRPSSVVSTGGHISIPVVLAAKLLGIPVELYELNVIPGRTIRALAPLSKKVFTTFEKSKTFFKDSKKRAYKYETCNYPLQFNEEEVGFNKTGVFRFINQCIKDSRIGLQLSFTRKRKTLFILGGSQGSIYLNTLLKKWFLQHKDSIENFQIIHQTGSEDKTDWDVFYQALEIPYFVFSYSSDIRDFYLLADYVVSRAGAGSLFELEFFKKNSLIIPLVSQAKNHQVVNAQEMVKRNPDIFSMCDPRDIEKDSSVFYNAVHSLIETNN
jgi:UDP-N-acetylglucosamine--N-acetylmuramyl-(pentapeptide) pyrophosphoryl-undecaprenol N-acetylglucosamine transferase